MPPVKSTAPVKEQPVGKPEAPSKPDPAKRDAPDADDSQSQNQSKPQPPKPLALGVQSTKYSLEKFTEKVDGRNLMGVSVEAWKAEFIQELEEAKKDPTRRIAMEISGLPNGQNSKRKTPLSVFKESYRVCNSRSRERCGDTQWEVYMLGKYGLLERVEWFFEFNPWSAAIAWKSYRELDFT